MKSTTGKYFVDTNIFVYLFSKTESEKREKCKAFLKGLGSEVSFVVSTQVINEFSAVMLRKFNMPPLELKTIIDDINEFEVVNTGVPEIKTAINIHILNQLSYWDSLIVSAARSANCVAIVSEDMNNGQLIEGMEIVNPMA